MPGSNDDPNRFELANGITLTLREASPWLMRSITAEVNAARPTPPMITREDRDGRQEPNEDDPEYKAAFIQWASDSGWRTLHTLAATCIIVTHVPDGINAHDSDAWAADVGEVYGLALETNPLRRLAQWLLLQVTDSDLTDLGPLLMYQAGTQEEEVQRALDSFRSVGQRSPDTGGAANGSHPDGDSVHPNPAGNRAARRRARSSKS